MTLIHDDCICAMRQMPEDSVDAVVTDPPAGISFMSKSWDSNKGGRRQWVAWFTEVMEEALRVAKPGAHAFVWALPRTSHWTAWALEDAGWEIRDRIAHIAGSGFPKSLNVQSAAQKAGLACKCQEYEVQYPVDGSLPILRENASQEATESATQVLLNEMHGPSKTNLANRKDVSVVRQEVGTQDTLSSRSQQDLQPKVRRETGAADIPNAEEAAADLPELRRKLRTEEQYGDIKSEVLFVPVRGQGEVTRPEDACSPQGDRQQWQGQEASRQGDGGRKESSLEGRSNLQTRQGQLQRSEVREMSTGVRGDGSQGRLHNGASSGDGDALGTVVGENGSGASHRPRPEEQRHQQSSAIQEQRRAQTCGRCGKPVVLDGLGTALKPAVEDWWLVRKPLSESSVSRNVLEHGTGALNIDGSRIGNGGQLKWKQPLDMGYHGGTDNGKVEATEASSGRWPSNVILSHSPECNGECVEGCPVAELDRQSGTLKSGGKKNASYSNENDGVFTPGGEQTSSHYGSEGGASRFFYCAKSSRRERTANGTVENGHPTVKSLALMRYLVKLVTPPGGVVLDPFAGSGSTLVAATQEGFEAVGIEREAEYCEIAERRVAHARAEIESQPLALEV